MLVMNAETQRIIEDVAIEMEIDARIKKTIAKARRTTIKNLANKLIKEGSYTLEMAKIVATAMVDTGLVKVEMLA